MFGLSNLSWHRPLTSYSKVQKLIGNLIRCRRFQLRSPRIASKVYLDMGCGPNIHESFINLEYSWRPGVDLCWDIVKGIPLTDRSLNGIFSEHCLEHFPLEIVIFLLGEFRRLLSPGGTLRLVVPDAELYFDIYRRKQQGDENATFPYEANESHKGIYSPVMSVNRVFYVGRDSLAGHRCMFDFALLSKLLISTGFLEVRRESFGTGSDPHLLIDTPSRSVESLYVEAKVL